MWNVSEGARGARGGLILLVVAACTAPTSGCQRLPPPDPSATSEYLMRGILFDTYVDQLQPDVNFGNSPELLAGNLGVAPTLESAQVPLVQFDTDAVRTQVGPQVVLSARLTYWVNHASSCAPMYQLHEVRQRWTESGATWRCPDSACTSPWNWIGSDAARPFVPAPRDVVGCTNFADGSVRLVFDVTADMQRVAQDRMAQHFGWAILVSHEGSHLDSTRASLSAHDQPPTLMIETGPPGFAPREPLPSTVPVLDRSTPTHVYDAMRWLFDPAFGLQYGTLHAIDRERATLIRGRVLDRDTGDPLAGVEVSVAGHPEFGRTRTRLASNGRSALGTFELLVNGGGPLLLRFRRDASTGGVEYLDAQRVVETRWNDWVFVPDVAMTPRSRLTCVTADSGMMLQPGPTLPLESSRGRRRLGLFVPTGTSITPPTPTPTWCFGEYTLDMPGGGPQAMGSELPSTTMFTYAMALEVHGRPTLTSASRVDAPTFNQDVFVYVLTNPDLAHPFINPSSTTGSGPVLIPSGSFDAEAGQWVPGADGQVFTVTRTPTFDVTTTPAITLSTEERRAIESDGVTFPDGARFWRIPVHHFSEGDANFAGAPGSLPTNAVPPAQAPNCGSGAPGSIIHCEDGALGETVPLTGTPYSLVYWSHRQRGRRDAFRVRFQAISAPITDPPGPDQVLAQLVVANTQSAMATYSAADAAAFHEIDWNGLDAYGRPLVGPQVAYLRLGYRYLNLPYRAAISPGRNFGTRPTYTYEISAGGTDATIWVTRRVVVGTIDDRVSGLGGWGIDVHHFYDPPTGTLYLGNGQRRTAESVAGIVSQVATSDQAGGLGAVAVSSNGDLFWWDHAIRGIRVRRRGESAVADLPTSYPGVSQIATGRARVRWPDGATVGDVLIVADNVRHAVYAVRPTDGTSVILVGAEGMAGPSPLSPGSPSTSPSTFLLGSPGGVAVARDGSVWIADSDRLLRYRDDGKEQLVELGLDLTGEGATLLATAPDDSVYFSATHIGNPSVRVLRASGEVDTILGGGSALGDRRDGAPASCTSATDTTCATVSPIGLAVDRDGHVCIADHAVTGRVAGRVRCVVNGAVYTIAGVRWTSAEGDIADPIETYPPDSQGTPATRTRIDAPGAIAAAPDGRIYVIDNQLFGTTQSRLRVVAPTLDGGLVTNHLIASSDGSQLYEFTAGGEHLRTLDALTSTTLVSFGYDPTPATLGRLTSITEFDGMTTAISYPSSTTIQLVAPGGLQTQLNLNGDGLATSIVAPMTNANCTVAGTMGCRTWTLAYHAGSLGLMETLTDPRPSIGSHTFIYDYAGTGRLVSDQDLDDTGGMNGPIQTVSAATIAPDGWTETVLTAPADTLDGTFAASARERRYRTLHADTGIMQRRVEHGPAGLLSFEQSSVPADGRGVTTTSSMGPTTITQLAPHPRWGMAAPFAGSTHVMRALGAIGSATRTLTYDGLAGYTETTTTTPSPTGTGSATVTQTTAPITSGWLVTMRVHIQRGHDHAATEAV